MLSHQLRAATPKTAAIQYVGGYTTSFVGTTADTTITFGGNLTGGLASSASAGDVVVVYYGVGGAAATNTLSITGYSNLAQLSSSDTTYTYLLVAYKAMGSTPDTTFVLKGGTMSGLNAGAVVVQVWRNVDNIVPIDTATQFITGQNSVLCNPPAITPVTPGAVIVAGGAGGHTTGTATYSSSNLTGFLSSGASDNYDVTVGAGYSFWNSGSFDPAAFTFSTGDSTAYSWAAVTLALSPVRSFSKQPPTYVSFAQTQETVKSNGLTINKPTGTVQGDLMIAFVTAGQGVTWTMPSGWTEIADQGSLPSIGVAYKVAGASEGSSYLFTCSASTYGSGAIVTYRGAAYDSIGTIVTSANPLTPTAPTASTTYSKLIGFAARGAPSIPITSTNMNQIAIDSDAQTLSSSWYLADETITSGSAGTRSFSVGSTADVAAVLVAISGTV